MQDFLSPGRFIDSDQPRVVAFAREVTAGANDGLDGVLRLYHTIRDDIVYDPYVDFADPENYRASSVLERRRTFCIGKAALLAATARAIGMPARVGYADVRNHMTSQRLHDYTGSDVFIWHSYAELLLDGAWVKATPVFNNSLCERLGLKPLEFDGRHDSLMHAFDKTGRRHMEYLKDRGSFADVPFDVIQADFRRYYPQLMTAHGLQGDFQAEARAASEEA